jgi:hypothetical protein
VGEHNLPGRLAVNADGLNSLEDGLPAALEHAVILRDAMIAA